VEGMAVISNPLMPGRRNTGKGVPEDIWRYGKPLTNRQQAVLDRLPDYDSRVTVRKNGVSMTDLSALTAKADVEFAMFTRGAERLIVRGDERKVNIDVNAAKDLSGRGYRWSGHTHTGVNRIPSVEDKTILECFAHKTSVVYNALGKSYVFSPY